MELKGELDKSIITVDDFNIPLSTTDRTTSRKSARIYTSSKHHKPTGSNQYSQSKPLNMTRICIIFKCPQNI